VSFILFFIFEDGRRWNIDRPYLGLGSSSFRGSFYCFHAGFFLVICGCWLRVIRAT
jgi:hypothetical protein